MTICGWFWRNREAVSFISQPLSIVEAPFMYGASRLTLLGKYGGVTINKILSNWDELNVKIIILKLNK